MLGEHDFMRFWKCQNLKEAIYAVARAWNRVKESNIRNALDNHEEKGYQIMGDDADLNNTPAEISSDTSSNCIIKRSHQEARDAVNVLLEYLDEQPEPNGIDVLQLRKMKESIRARIYESQKQKQIIDFFKVVNCMYLNFLFT